MKKLTQLKFTGMDADTLAATMERELVGAAIDLHPETERDRIAEILGNRNAACFWHAAIDLGASLKALLIRCRDCWEVQIVGPLKQSILEVLQRAGLLKPEVYEDNIVVIHNDEELGAIGRALQLLQQEHALAA